QSSRYALPARGIAAAKTASGISSRSVGLFLPKYPASLDRRRGRQRAAVRAPNPRAAKPLSLRAAARQSRDDSRHFSGRNKIDNPAIAAELREAVSKLHQTNESH